MKGILQNKVAVITGGTRGLGFAMAEAYAREGAKVVIASRTQTAVDKAVRKLRENGAQVEGLACDVSNLKQVEALAEFALQKFGGLDIWVNNAGLSAAYGPTAHIPSDNFQSVIDTNITGTYNGSVTAMRHFVRQKSGKLINLLGRGDKGAVPLQNAYSSSKVWVRNFTKALAKEYAKSGVDVFGFNPGLVRTDMLSNIEAVSGYEGRLNPLRYITLLWGNDADVPAAKAVWLASASTDGKNGLQISILTTHFMVARLIKQAFHWLTRKPSELMDLNITSIEPEISGD
jgi:NAD(P)-dependent dehydrogenase (short-subunit alcohol dehydrogenase family)